MDGDRTYMTFDAIAVAAQDRAADLLYAIAACRLPGPSRAKVLLDPRMLSNNRKAPKPDRMLPLSVFHEDIAEAVALGFKLPTPTFERSDAPIPENAGLDGSRLIGQYEALNGRDIEEMYHDHRRLLDRRRNDRMDLSGMPDPRDLGRFGSILADLALGVSKGPLPGVQHIPMGYAYHARGSTPDNHEHKFSVAACKAILGDASANVFDFKRVGYRICGALEATNGAGIEELGFAFREGRPVPDADEGSWRSHRLFAEAIVSAARSSTKRIGPIAIPGMLCALVQRDSPAFGIAAQKQDEDARPGHGFPGR